MPPVSEGAKPRPGEISPSPNVLSEFPAQTGSEWYAAYTIARHEKAIARQLDERQIECFLPLYRSWRRWADRRKQIELALFPSYIFVRIQLTERLRVLQLPGVVRLVTFDGKPALLPQSEIEALRNGLENGIFAQPHPYLQVGRKVRVVRGPLTGAQGILLRKKDKFRFVISIDVLMRSVAVELGAPDVVPAD